MIGVVLKGYPRLSETFIAEEIKGLEQAGLPLVLISLRHPTDREIHPVHREIGARVVYLPEYLHQEPRRVLAAWWRVRGQRGYRAALNCWWRDLRRDPTPNRVRRFGQALVLAAELGPQLVHLHAHFLHTPASVARYAAMIAGIEWTVSAHAKDIWTTRAWEKREKLAAARWAVTCTAANAEHLRELADLPAKVELVYHGLDLDRFSPPAARAAGPDGTDPEVAVTLLSVGRLVPKKGYGDLLAALARLPATLRWQFVHIGSGPLAATLQAEALEAGIADRIRWLGALAQEEVLDWYRRADLFVLPCRITDDGDRDGLPNVLVEAQSQGLACLSTRISGVPELLDDDVNGVLTESGDVAGLAGALARLIGDPVTRDRLGRAGMARVHESFSAQRAIAHLEPKLRATLRGADASTDAGSGR